MDTVEMGRAGLTGLRGKMGRAAAPTISRTTPLDDRQAEAAIGWVLLGLTALQFLLLALKVLRAGRRGERR